MHFCNVLCMNSYSFSKERGCDNTRFVVPEGASVFWSGRAVLPSTEVGPPFTLPFSKEHGTQG